MFLAADHARRSDPTLAARYHRLMVIAGKHHNSAICHIAKTLLTRVVACWRRGETYAYEMSTAVRSLPLRDGRSSRSATRYQVSFAKVAGP
jgi:hypothetical protein